MAELSGWQTVIMTLGAAGLGGVIGAVSSRMGIGQQDKLQRERERRAHARQFHEQELRELREAYSALVFHAEVFRTVTIEGSFSSGAESLEQKLQRLGRQVEEQTKDAPTQIRRLTLEPDSQPVVDAYTAVLRTYTQYGVVYSSPPYERRGLDFRDAAANLDTAVEHLRAIASERLERLKTTVLE